ncbi:hypothetical protein BD289DRAFT_166207 [Coniella lustricola]|uniref:Uncharacterized protein n=1 Tax=Coniella lustricola TaxID=2025994 RepID=A0A2T3AE78_9PEZI|nr:hypothetical protein BD289DRAFT_166207 [Coniella lustricola]
MCTLYSRSRPGNPPVDPLLSSYCVQSYSHASLRHLLLAPACARAYALIWLTLFPSRCVCVCVCVCVSASQAIVSAALLFLLLLLLCCSLLVSCWCHVTSRIPCLCSCLSLAYLDHHHQLKDREIQRIDADSRQTPVQNQAKSWPSLLAFFLPGSHGIRAYIQRSAVQCPLNSALPPPQQQQQQQLKRPTTQGERQLEAVLARLSWTESDW